jgi:hypothetical protein
MNAPEPQSWAWDEEPAPHPGWEFETQWGFGSAIYTRYYTRPVVKHTKATDEVATITVHLTAAQVADILSCPGHDFKGHSLFHQEGE